MPQNLCRALKPLESPLQQVLLLCLFPVLTQESESIHLDGFAISFSKQ